MSDLLDAEFRFDNEDRYAKTTRLTDGVFTVAASGGGGFRISGADDSDLVLIEMFDGRIELDKHGAVTLWLALSQFLREVGEVEIYPPAEPPDAPHAAQDAPTGPSKGGSAE